MTKRPALLWIGLTAVSALLVGHALVFDFVSDDAFISFRYADNLVRHGALVFNVGERVEGYTNFLWTLLMSGVLALGFDPVPWSKAFGIVFGVATLWVLAWFSARQDGKASAWDLVAPLLLAGAPAYACWSTGGLETQLFTFTATLGWTTYLCEVDEPSHRARLAALGGGMLFALSALTRPEGILLFGLTGLHRLGLRAGIERHRLLRRDWLWAAGFVVVFVPYYAWRWAYYGWPLPNTYYAKAAGSAFWAPGWRYFWSWAVVHYVWLVPALAAARLYLAGRREGRFLALAGLWTFGFSLHVMRVGGDFMALHRFFVPLMPMVALVAANGLRTIGAALLAARQPRRRLAAGAAVMALMMGYHVACVDTAALKISHDDGIDSIGWLSLFAGQTAAIGRWLGEHAPRGSTLSTTAAGTIPYYSRLYTLDQLGLSEEWIAHNVPPQGDRPGHTKGATWSYIADHQIDYAICHPTISERPLAAGGCGYDSPPDGYVWRSVQVPGLAPLWWGYWERQR